MAKKKTSTVKASAKRSGATKRKKASGPARKTKAATRRAVVKKAPAKKSTSRKAASQKDAKRKKSAIKKKIRPKKKAAAKAATKKATGVKKKAGAKKKVATSVKRSGAKVAGPRKASATRVAGKKVARTKVSSKASVKKSAFGVSPKKVSPPVEETYVEPSIPKTRLTDQQLRIFKEMLLEKRRTLAGDVRTLTSDALGRSRQDSSGDLSSMPIHMADLGTDNWEQDFTLGLIANEQKLVREIDDALLRIESRTYGVCLSTHKPITLARLRAKPWAKYCIEYARAHELGRH